MYLFTWWKVKVWSEYTLDLPPHGTCTSLVNAAYNIFLMTGSSIRHCCTWSSDTYMHPFTWYWPATVTYGTIITMIILISKNYIWQRWCDTASQRTMTQTTWAGCQGMAVFWEYETWQADEPRALTGCTHLCHIWGSRKGSDFWGLVWGMASEQ